MVEFAIFDVWIFWPLHNISYQREILAWVLSLPGSAMIDERELSLLRQTLSPTLCTATKIFHFVYSIELRRILEKKILSPWGVKNVLTKLAFGLNSSFVHNLQKKKFEQAWNWKNSLNLERSLAAFYKIDWDSKVKENVTSHVESLAEILWRVVRIFLFVFRE